MKRLTVLERAKLPMNDLGNARRVLEATNGRLLWLADANGGKGSWIAFDGVRWSTDEGPVRALAYAQKAATAIADEVAELRDCEPEQLSGVFGPKFSRDMADKRMAQLWAWAMKSGDSAKTTAMLSQFKGLRDTDCPDDESASQFWSTGLAARFRCAADGLSLRKRHFAVCRTVAGCLGTSL